MTKYIKQEMNDEQGLNTIQHMIKLGLDRIELRDEIFCQLIRQTNENPDDSVLIQAWVLMCLCTAAFSPSKSLHKVRLFRIAY